MIWIPIALFALLLWSSVSTYYVASSLTKLAPRPRWYHHIIVLPVVVMIAVGRWWRRLRR